MLSETLGITRQSGANNNVSARNAVPENQQINQGGMQQHPRGGANGSGLSRRAGNAGETPNTRSFSNLPHTFVLSQAPGADWGRGSSAGRTPLGMMDANTEHGERGQHKTATGANRGLGSAIVCTCGSNARLLTVQKEGPNKGRQFYACGMPQNGGCNLFLWADEQDTTRSSASGLTVQKDGPNKGKEFYGCAKPRAEGCGFFQWAQDTQALGSRFPGATSFPWPGRGAGTAGTGQKRKLGSTSMATPSTKRPPKAIPRRLVHIRTTNGA